MRQMPRPSLWIGAANKIGERQIYFLSLIQERKSSRSRPAIWGARLIRARYGSLVLLLQTMWPSATRVENQRRAVAGGAPASMQSFMTSSGLPC